MAHPTVRRHARGMANLDSNDPYAFGWSYPATDIVPFTFAGHPFLNGLSRRLVPLFTTLLLSLSRQPGFRFHTGSGPDDGDWGYEDRSIYGGGTLSFHGYGCAVDVNAPWNPQGVPTFTGGVYGIPDSMDAIALSLGVLWGGNARFSSNPDRMHFENHNSPAELLALHGGPVAELYPLAFGHWFGTPESGPGAVSGYGATSGYRSAIEQIQRMGGVTRDGLYGPHTAGAVGSWQRYNHLTVDGIVGPITWGAMGL